MRHRKHLAPRDVRLTRSVRSTVVRPTTNQRGSRRANGAGARTLVIGGPHHVCHRSVNGHADCGLRTLVVPAPVYGNKRPLSLGSPIETVDNGNAQMTENERRLNLGSPIETVDNGNAQMTEYERRLNLGSPLETADNGNAQMTEYERRLNLRPPSPNGDNGETMKISRLRPPSPNGDNRETTKNSRPRPPSPNGDNGEISVLPRRADKDLPSRPKPPWPSKLPLVMFGAQHAVEGIVGEK
jgi:hypothetical protein